MSLYLRLLGEASNGAGATVSSGELARWGGTTSAQVRKDLSHFGSFGKRGLGYSVAELRDALQGILGLDRRWRVALIGAGRIGTALMSYHAFRERGFEIRAVFDADPAKLGTVRQGLKVRGVEKLEEGLRRDQIDIAIIATPAGAAREVAGRVVKAGVRAILNFAPVSIEVPVDVALRSVDMTVELEGLAFALNQGVGKKQALSVTSGS